MLYVSPFDSRDTLTASAATSGYYTYEVSNGEATITGVKKSISGNITIPSMLGGYPVKSIANLAFSHCTSLISITIPDSVISIDDEAFSWCDSLKSVTMGNSVTSIGYSAFESCYSLTSITIPNSVTSIGDEAFESCSNLTSITIPDSVTSIGDYAFYFCTSLKNVHYNGEESDWKNVLVGSHNKNLTDNLHYNNQVTSATCTQMGSCGYDGCDYSEPALGHNFIFTENGYKYCTRCDYCANSHPDYINGEYKNGYGWADIDNDGKIAYNDLELLNKVVANAQFGNGDLVCKAADVNGDGKIDTKDIVRIKKILGIIPGGGTGAYTTLKNIPAYIG